MPPVLMVSSVVNNELVVVVVSYNKIMDMNNDMVGYMGTRSLHLFAHTHTCRQDMNENN